MSDIDLTGKTNGELMILAKSNTLSNQEMIFFSNHKCSDVRRVLARNSSITSEIANKLLYDCLENVSYMASKNPKTTKKREFRHTIATCSKCMRDDLTKECGDSLCAKVKKGVYSLFFGL